VGLLALAAVAVSGTIAATANSVITPFPKNRSAEPIAKAFADDPKQVTDAFFSVIPPRGNPAAVSTTRLAAFPRAGKSYAILSTGDARLASRKNTSESTGKANLGPFIRGARDVTIMRTFLRVPKGASCLSIRFRFLSDEFPEFVNEDFNDAFIAELDGSTWEASGDRGNDPGKPDENRDPTISAPKNFAQDAKGNPIRVNTVGDTSVTAKAAKGTTYDGATRLLRASTPITPGRHSLYLSIFDQGDRDFDSAVFLDRLTLDDRSPCRSGAVKDS